MRTVHAMVYGKEYTLACDEGQEQHLQGLIKQVNGRAERLDKAVGKLPEPLMLLYTALMLADELHDAQKENTRLKQGIDSSAGTGDDTRLAILEEEVATNLQDLASRIQYLAEKLEA